MDDLLRTTLEVDDPADEVVDRSRHRLQNHIHGGRKAHGKRIAWLSGGVGITVAAAVAIAVLPGAQEGTPAPKAAPDPTTTSAPRPATGEEILLAAATVAARAEDASGTYWHVTINVPNDTYEFWTTPDGQSWFKGRKTKGVPSEMSEHDPAFSLFAVGVTLEQLRALPTDPAALRAWIAEALEHSGARSSKGPFDAEDREMATFYSLISLVSTVPAPPEVRAAAFRALAAYPDVESIGEVPGGQGLLLPGGARLVVDPATGRVNGSSMYVTAEGAIYGVSDPEGARISAEWTDVPPA